MFVLNNQFYSYNTKNLMVFHLPLYRTNIRQFSVRFLDTKLSNCLLLELDNMAYVSLSKYLKIGMIIVKCMINYSVHIHMCIKEA